MKSRTYQAGKWLSIATPNRREHWKTAVIQVPSGHVVQFAREALRLRFSSPVSSAVQWSFCPSSGQVEAQLQTSLDTREWSRPFQGRPGDRGLWPENWAICRRAGVSASRAETRRNRTFFQSNLQVPVFNRWMQFGSASSGE